jgi:hypothetical protein
MFVVVRLRCQTTLEGSRSYQNVPSLCGTCTISFPGSEVLPHHCVSLRYMENIFDPLQEHSAEAASTADGKPTLLKLFP